MNAAKDTGPQDRPAQKERARPIPNADRRRKGRKIREEKAGPATPVVITDWASI